MSFRTNLVRARSRWPHANMVKMAHHQHIFMGHSRV